MMLAAWTASKTFFAEAVENIPKILQKKKCESLWAFYYYLCVVYQLKSLLFPLSCHLVSGLTQNSSCQDCGPHLLSRKLQKWSRKLPSRNHLLPNTSKVQLFGKQRQRMWMRRRHSFLLSRWPWIWGNVIDSKQAKALMIRHLESEKWTSMINGNQT